MPVCAHCGSRNAEGLRFCQDCGQKLGAAAPAPAPAPAPVAAAPVRVGPEDKRPGIPDTSARSSAPALGPVVSCPRCRVDNRPGMNFCKMCGALLPRPTDDAPAAATRERTVMSASVAAASLPAPGSQAPTPPSPSRPPAAGAVVQAFPMGPICSRCRGANTPGAEFCRFCGTPLASAGMAAAASSDTGRDTVVVRRVEPAGPARPGMSTVPSSVSPIAPGPAALAEAAVHAGGGAAHAEAIAAPQPDDALPEVVEVSPARAAPLVRLAVATQAMGATSAYALAQLTTILRDGSTGATYPLTAEQTDIGREEGNILLPDDPYICPRHARVIRREGRFLLRDLGSVNGIFLRISGSADLKNRDAFLVGQELLIFELVEDGEGGLGPAVQHGTLVFGAPEVPRLARLGLWTTEGVPRDVYTLHRQETILGREVGDIVFPEDAFMSRRHAAVTCDLQTRHFTLRDLDSSNGTYLRFRGEREVRFGDRFRIGQHLFRFDPAGAT